MPEAKLETKELHAVAHKLCAQLVHVVTEWLSTQTLSTEALITALKSTEMAASVFRRALKEAGAPKQLVKDVQMSASECGRQEFDQLQKLGQFLLEKLEASPPASPEVLFTVLPAKDHYEN